jgi:hypothetical protein
LEKLGFRELDLLQKQTIAGTGGKIKHGVGG